MTPQYQPATVNDTQLKEIKKLEKDLGKIVVALESPRYAQLTAEQLSRLQSAEKKLGVVIVAYESD